MRIRRALAWVAFWACMALLFNLGIYLLNPSFIQGISAEEKALQFFGGYIIELSLSVDNLFVFLVIFSSFNIPPRHQRRALNYGIIGAVVLRLAFILLGVELVDRFHWLLIVFGGLLVISGIVMFFKGEKEKDYKKSKVLNHIGKVIPYTGTLEGEKFFVRRNGRLYATLLFAVVIIIESADLIFNVDSVPAILSMTQDRFLMFTSNVFAILGLRSLYFVLERLSQMFRYIKYGVAIILVLTGIKLIVDFKDTLLFIGVIVVILLLSVFVSIVFKEKKRPDTKKIAE